jgi:glucokinase
VVQQALALDIGGTKLGAGVVDNNGDLVQSASVPTEGDLFSALTGLVDEVRTGHEVVVGVGCGGPMRDNNELVSPLNIAAWRDFPLRARLAELTALPVFVDNDAKALALGEGWVGAAAGCQNFIAMVVSTGVGGGIVLDGRLLDGRDRNAGHIGHVIVEPGGRVCGCGAQGCLEAEASGLAIAAASGRPAAEAGADVIERTGRLVGRAVASVANLLDLELAVVAGSVALGFGAPFFEAAQAEIDERARLDFSRDTQIVPAGLGPSGPLVGAAAVGFAGMVERPPGSRPSMGSGGAGPA